MLRVEMLTGTTIYAQAAKCREFLDILPQNGILKQIQRTQMGGILIVTIAVQMY